MERSRGRLEVAILAVGLLGLAVYLPLRFVAADWASIPLQTTLLLGGSPLVLLTLIKTLRGDLGADLLAALALAASAALQEWLAGTLVVVMLAGGAALERLAVARAGSALGALARRAPSVAHRKRDGILEDVPLDELAPGDVLSIHPHEVCPVDGVVLDGRSVMDESYLTGEPYEMPKAPGSEVLSGAVNGEGLLLIRAVRRAADSRFERILGVLRESEQRRPRLRRLADRLAAVYVPVALAVAGAAWAASDDPRRFLAVLAVATPCPLLIGIPVALLGAVSLAARRGIVIRDPAVLERLPAVRTLIIDKTGTLTAGRPSLTDIEPAPGWDPVAALALAASLEAYSRHPLAGALVRAARERRAAVVPASEVREVPGRGLEGHVDGRVVRVTGRKGLEGLPPAGASGLECILLVEERFAALFRFHDAPREESRSFIGHLPERHAFTRLILLTGDREAEAVRLAREVGISEIHAGRSPEQKVDLVRAETAKAPTLFVGDGINDAPALLQASVGIAFGRRSDVTAEAAGAVILEDSLTRVDELFHIAARLRGVALQTAVGGMILSAAGMAFAAAGLLSPAAGALVQEAIDLLAIANALRMAAPAGRLSDF